MTWHRQARKGGRLAPAWALCACVACAGAAQKVPPPAPKVVAEPHPEPGPGQRLLAALEAIEKAAPLDALSSDARADLEGLVTQWSEEEKAAIRDGGAYAGAHPLWHLWLGGTEPEAFVAIALSPRGSTDLVEARRASGGAIDGGLARVAGEVSRSAARRVLSDHATRLRDSAALPIADYEVVVQLVRQLESPRLEVLAAEVGAGELDVPRAELDLARARARALDVEGAEAALLAGSVRQDEEQTDPDAALRRSARQVVAAARTVAAGLAEDSRDESLRVARAALGLGRYEDALAALGARRKRASKDLALAAVVGRALTRGSTCPGVPPAAAEAALCAVAAASDHAYEESVKLLVDAWAAGAGRDARALETYFGLVHVVPLGSDVPAHRQAALENLARALANVPDPSARLAALAVFVDVLATNEPGDELVGRARALAPGDELACGATLAVAARLGPTEDARALLQGLEPPGCDALVEPFAVLELEQALAAGDDQSIRAARNALTDAMLGANPLDRSRLILLLAEADLAHSPTQRARDVLAKVAEPLAGPDTPRPLRFRALVDLAGLDHQAGRIADARERLKAGVDLGAEGTEPEAGVLQRYLEHLDEVAVSSSKAGGKASVDGPRRPVRRVELGLRYDASERIEPRVRVDLWWIPGPWDPSEGRITAQGRRSRGDAP